MGILSLGALTYFVIHEVRSRPTPIGVITRRGFSCALAYGAGLIPFLWLLVRDVARYGLQETVWQATGGPFHGIMLKGNWAYAFSDTAYLVALQFPSVYLCWPLLSVRL